jgi:hypothetical protein
MTCHEVKKKRQKHTDHAIRSADDPADGLCDRMPPVSQKDLQEVFCGLVKNIQTQ